MNKTTTFLAVALGVALAPALFALHPVPEPNATPELAIWLAGIGAGYWLLRRMKKNPA